MKEVKVELVGVVNSTFIYRCHFFSQWYLESDDT